MFKAIVLQQLGDGLLRRADRFLLALPQSIRVIGVVLIQSLLFLAYLNAGPWVPLTVFFIFNLYLAAKYVGSEFSYVMAFMAAVGKTYIKIGFYPDDALWWQAHWQFISSFSLYTLFCYLINSQIAGRRHVEVALDDLSELSDAIITKTDSGVLVFDGNGKCVFANPSVASMLGVTVTRLRHCELERDETLFPPSLAAAMRETLRGGERRQLTVQLGTPAGEVWSVVSIAQIRRAASSYLLMVFADISAYKAAQDAAAAAMHRAGAAERKLVDIGEEVQQRLGRELHDDLGQHLAGVAFMSEVLFQNLKGEGRAEMHDAAKITAMVNEAVNKVRYLSQGLYPDELKEKGFCAMMKKLAAYAEATGRVSCEFACDSDHRTDDPELAIHLFRISQEAVSNAIRHGHAKHIHLSMNTTPNERVLTIDDDGCGLGNATGSHKGGGLGMRTMKYRADLIGATLRVSGLPTGGTRVAVSLPIAR